MAKLEWVGFDRLIVRLGAIAHPDAGPLMLAFEDVIVEDNERGSLAGTDRYDVPYPAVTYRPIKSGPVKPAKRQVNNDRRGVFAGMGPAAAGLNNNLSSYEYRRLGGPPLAPRGPASRIITNLVTDSDSTAVDGVWTAFGFWKEIVSTKGYHFMPDLWAGKGRYGAIPARDPRGVRSAGRAEALAAAKVWLANVVKGKA
jgi:hypothetical protein